MRRILLALTACAGLVGASGAQASPTPPSVTRPNNTTTYTANTGWSSATSACTSAACYFTFTNACAFPGEQVAVPEVDVWDSANQATALGGVLWLFNTLPATIINDDATFNIAAADFANLTAGSFNGIPFTLASAQASGAANAGISLNGSTLGSPLVATCDASKAIYGMVQVVNAYVPLANEKLTIQIKTLPFF